MSSDERERAIPAAIQSRKQTGFIFIKKVADDSTDQDNPPIRKNTEGVCAVPRNPQNNQPNVFKRQFGNIDGIHLLKHHANRDRRYAQNQDKEIIVPNFAGKKGQKRTNGKHMDDAEGNGHRKTCQGFESKRHDRNQKGEQQEL